MRGNKSKERKANHIVSVWCDMDVFLPWVKKVEEKSNEITVNPTIAGHHKRLCYNH